MTASTTVSQQFCEKFVKFVSLRLRAASAILPIPPVGAPAKIHPCSRKKTNLTKQQIVAMKIPTTCLLVLSSLALASTALAAEVIKANNTDNLDLGSSWFAGTAPGTADVAVWDSTVTGPNAVSFGADLSWAGIRITNVGGAVTVTAANTLTLGTSGINLSGASQSLSLNCPLTLGGAQTWTVASGQTLTAAGALSKGGNALTLSGAGSVSLNGSPTGTGGLYLNGGNVLYNATGGMTADFRIGNSSTSANTFSMSGGDLTVTNQLYFSYGTGSSGSFTQSGGTLTLNGLRGANQTGGVTTMLFNGGTLNSLSDAFMLSQRGTTSMTISNSANAAITQITMCGWAGSGSSTVNLDGGALTTDGFWETTVSGLTPAANGSYTTTVNFNGTYVTARTANQAANFLRYVDSAYVKEGGAKLDTSIYSITIAKALAHGGVAATDGGLTKLGTGTLMLSGANAYTGPTVVSNGTLVLTAGSYTGALSLNDGVTLRLGSAAVQMQPASFSEGSSVGSATNEFSLVSSTTQAPIRTGVLTLQGTTTVNILSGTFFAGRTYPLIHYTSSTGAGGFALGTLPPGVVATLVTNGAAGNFNLALSVTAAPITLWAGAVNGTWDINTTANWSTNGIATTYLDGATVQFDDTAALTAVSNAVTVAPGGIFMSNDAKSYTFTGSALSGGGSLTKSGTNSVAFTNSLAGFTGPTTLNAGVMQVASTGSLPQGPIAIASGATLALNPGATMTVSSAVTVSGNGLIALQGPAPTGNNGIDLHVANPAASLSGFTGNIVISNNVRAIPDGAIYDPFATAEVAAGGQLFLGDTLGTTNGLGLIKIAGRGSNPSGGTGPLGALRVEHVISSGVGATWSGPVLLTTNAAVGNAANGRASLISGNISGPYELEIIPRYNFTNSATIVRLSGTNTYGATRIDGGNGAPYNSLPARLIADSATALSSGAMTLDGGLLDVNGYSFSFANLNSTTNGGIVQNGNTNGLSAVVTVGTDNTSTGFGGALVTGTSMLGLTKVGTGTLNLSGTNSYAGPTVVSNGTLTLIAQSLTGTVTVATNGTLSGSGTTLSGPVTVDGTLSPSTNAGPIAAWNLAGGLTLNPASRTVMAIDRAGGTYAQIAGGGAVNFGGTLVVTNLGGTFTTNDVFTLFQAGTYNGNFAATQFYPATPGPGMAWDTTQLASAGIVSVVSGSTVVRPTIDSRKVLSGGSFQLTFSGPAGQSFRVLGTNVVNAPLANWPVLMSGTFGVGGPIPTNFIDANVTGTAKQRFYIIESP
jgi:autotransporter-associated beta strand protein